MLHDMLHRVNPLRMTDPIVIKKYENRRLYDTHSSRYVNLEGVAELVRGGRDIQVVDSKTGEDVTRHVLTQIIVDGRDFFQWYLKSAGKVYERVRETMQRSPFAPHPSWMRLWDPRAMAEEMHAQMTRQMEGVLGRGGGAGRGREAQKPPAPPPTAASAPEDGGDATRAELDELKGRLQDLERRLADAPD